MNIDLIGGNRYFVIFTDDKSRMVMVYFMKEKSEVFWCLATVEN